ncbi:MAG: hypothetical protein LBU32_03855 [Clostridiales bacterium]|nr:hypothetical protein [Clostridiales bacterium]
MKSSIHHAWLSGPGLLPASLAACGMPPSGRAAPPARSPLNFFGAQQLSGPAPSCRRLKRSIAGASPRLAASGMAVPCRTGFAPVNAAGLARPLRLYILGQRSLSIET